MGYGEGRKEGQDISSRLRVITTTLQQYAEKAEREGLDVDDRSVLMDIVKELEEYNDNFGVRIMDRMIVGDYLLPSATNLSRYGVEG